MKNIFAVNNRKSYWKLALFIALPILVGLISALVSGNLKAAYMTMQRPMLSPPTIVFPIVWNLLYILLGFASYRYLLTIPDEQSKHKTMHIVLFSTYLLLNFLWTPIFFRAQLYIFGTVIAGLLFAIVSVMSIIFAKRDKAAAIMMLPLVIWHAFALYLSIGLTILN